jgi:O-antigen/teichoic acid export membrane protein
MLAEADRLHPRRLHLAVMSRIAYLVVQGGSSVATFALLARLLDPVGLGAAAVALSVFVGAQALSDLGLGQLATVELPAIAAARNPQATTRTTAALATLFVRAALVAMLLAAAVALLVPAGARLATLAIAPAAGASLLVTGAESLARARGELRAPLAYVAAGRLGFFLAIPLLLGDPSAADAIAVFSATTAIGALPALRALLAVRATAPSSSVRPLLRRALGLGLATGLVTIGTRGNVLILAHIEGLTTVGAFEAAWRGFQLAVYAVGALGTAMTPFAAQALAAHGRRALLRLTLPGLAVTVAAGVLATVAIFLLSGPLTSVLYGAGDPDARSALEMLALALPLTYAAYFVQSAIVLPLRQTGTLLVASAALCLVTVGVTVALADAHGAAGAATGVVAGQAALLGVLVAGLGRQLRARR